MATGFSFAYDPQMSVREKIERYFQQKKNALPVLDESTSDESLANSFSALDESFAQILNNNPHVTLIRNSKKGNATQIESTQAEMIGNHSEDGFDDTFYENHQLQTTKPVYMPTPTRRGEVKLPFRNNDSGGPDPSFWEVSDESFLEMEKLCESLPESPNTTLLDDVEAPSFLIHDSFDDSVFEPAPSSVSILSPMKLVALRRPSTILEESTIQSINSSKERSGASLSLKQSLNVENESSESDKKRSFRPSLVNVFPTRSRIGYYNNFDSTSSPSSAKPPVKQNIDKENSINLMTFESIERELPSSPPTPTNGNNSISLMRFDSLGSSSVDEASFSNLSVDQTHCNSSMSDGEPPDQFNDTLEAVDYYMKQGKKIMDKTSASVLQQVIPSPKSRNNSLLKQTLARRHLMSMNGDNLNKLTGKKLF